MDLQTSKFLINDIEVCFHLDPETTTKLNNDDEYTLDYVTKAINSGDLEKQGISKTILETGIVQVSRLSEEETTSEKNFETITLLTEASPHTKTNLIWQGKGKESINDYEASEFMLELRSSEKYKKLFNDKKTLKVGLWKEIAEEMNQMGFFVGHGKDAAERVRQKFQNLTKSYFNFLQHIKSMGGARRPKPPHYEKLHKIWSDSNKITPLYIRGGIQIVDVSPKRNSNLIKETSIGSQLPTQKTQEVSSESQNLSTSLVDTIVKLWKDQQTLQDQQTQQLVGALHRQNELLTEQNNQRKEMINLLRNIVRKKRRFINY